MVDLPDGLFSCLQWAKEQIALKYLKHKVRKAATQGQVSPLRPRLCPVLRLMAFFGAFTSKNLFDSKLYFVMLTLFFGWFKGSYG